MGEAFAPLVVGGTYRHYKGQCYLVHGLARHSETLQEMVVYEALYENELGKMWVRPLELFLGTVLVNGQTVLRFVHVP